MQPLRSKIAVELAYKTGEEVLYLATKYTCCQSVVSKLQRTLTSLCFKMSSFNKSLVLILILCEMCCQIRADGDAAPEDGSDPLYETSDRDFNRSYKTISNYLTRFVSDDDIEPNLKIAKEWLTKDLKTDSQADKRLVDALKLFVSLKDTLYGRMCNQSGHEVLFKNLLATEQRGRGKRTDYRTDRIVYHSCLDHARACQKSYPIAFEKIYRAMDPIKRTRVEIFLNDRNLQDFQRGATNRFMFYNTLVKNQQRIQGKNTARMVFEAIYTIFIGDEDSDYSPHEDTIIREETMKEMFKQYIVEPCVYFVEKLGPDVFVPVIFDAMFYHRVNEENFRFYNAWTRFKMCSFVIDNEDSIKYQLLHGSEDALIDI